MSTVNPPTKNSTPGDADFQHVLARREVGPEALGTLLVQESADRTPTDGTMTATDVPDQAGPFDNLGGTILSLLLLVGGGVVALLLVRG